jgi:hypothetical protein
MKTRNGFVSNSSSSSFVIITTQDKWNEAVKKFKKIAGENITKIVVGEYGEPEKAKVLGQDALIFSGIICSEDYGNSVCDELINNTKCNEDEVYDLAVEAFEKMGEFNDILRNDGVSYVS